MNFGLKARQFLSILTLVSFLFQNIAWAAPELPTLINETREASVPQIQIEIPREAGEIRSIYQAPSSESWLLHIQDAHGSYEAQKNIEKIIRHVVETYGADLLFIEGAHEKVEAARFRFFKDNSMNLDVADILMRHGEFSGPEMFLLSRGAGGARIEAVGIEDPGVYRRDYEIFCELIRASAESKRYFDELDSAVNVLESRHFSNDLRDFIKEWRGYHQNGSNLLRYIQASYVQAQKSLDMDLKDPRHQIAFESTLRVLKLKDLESRLDHRMVRKEKKTLLGFLKGKVDPALLAEIETLGVPGKEGGKRLPRFILERLYDQAGPQGLDLKNYPHFAAYAEYLIFQSEIASSRLFSELDQLTDKIFDALAKTEEEQKLLRLIRDVTLLEKLFTLEMSRSEYRAALARQSEFSPMRLFESVRALSAVKLELPSVKEMEAKFAKALEFYRLAEEREAHFLDRIEKNMKESKRGRAILVTGGFHTEGVQERLRSRKLSYVSVSPRIPTIGDSHEIYLRAMLGETRITDSKIPKSPRLAQDREVLVGPEMMRRDAEVDVQAVRERLSAEGLDAEAAEAVVTRLMQGEREIDLEEGVPVKAAALGMEDVIHRLAEQGYTFSNDRANVQDITMGRLGSLATRGFIYDVTTNPDSLWEVYQQEMAAGSRGVFRTKIRDLKWRGVTDTTQVYDELFMDQIIAPAMRVFTGVRMQKPINGTLLPVNHPDRRYKIEYESPVTGNTVTLQKETPFLHGYASYEMRPLFTPNPDRPANDAEFNHEVALVLLEIMRLSELVMQKSIGRKNFFIKVPATPAGIEAGKRAIGLGFNINFTLVSTAEQFEKTVIATIQGKAEYVKNRGEAYLQELSALMSRVSEFPEGVPTQLGQYSGELDRYREYRATLRPVPNPETEIGAEAVISTFLRRNDDLMNQLLAEKGRFDLTDQASIAYFKTRIYPIYERYFAGTGASDILRDSLADQPELRNIQKWLDLADKTGIRLPLIYLASTSPRDANGEFTIAPTYIDPLKGPAIVNTSRPHLIDHIEQAKNDPAQSRFNETMTIWDDLDRASDVLREIEQLGLNVDQVFDRAYRDLLAEFAAADRESFGQIAKDIAEVQSYDPSDFLEEAAGDTLSRALEASGNLVQKARDFQSYSQSEELYMRTIFALATVYITSPLDKVKRFVGNALKELGEATDGMLAELRAQEISKTNMERLKQGNIEIRMVVNISATSGAVREQIQKDRLDAVRGDAARGIDSVDALAQEVRVNPHDSYVDETGLAVDSYHWGSLTGAIRGFEPIFAAGTGMLAQQGLTAEQADRRAREQGKVVVYVVDLKGGAGTRSALQTIIEAMNKAFIKIHNREFGEQGNQQILQLIGDPENPEQSLPPGAYVVIVPADNIAIFEPTVGAEYHLGQDADLFTPAARVLGASLQQLNYFSGLGNLFRDPETHGVKRFSEKPKKFTLIKLVLLNGLGYLFGANEQEWDSRLYHRLQGELAQYFPNRQVPADFIARTLELVMVPYFFADNPEVLDALEEEFKAALAAGDTTEDWALYLRNWQQAKELAARTKDNVLFKGVLDRFLQGSIPYSNLNTFYFKLNLIQAQKLFELMSRPLIVQPPYVGTNPAPYDQATYWKVVSDIGHREPGKQPKTYEMSDWSTIVLTSVTLTREEWAQEREKFMARKKVPAEMMYSPEDWQQMRLFIFEMLKAGMRDAQGQPTLPARKADFENLMYDHYQANPAVSQVLPLDYWEIMADQIFDFLVQDNGFLTTHEQFNRASGNDLTKEDYDMVLEGAIYAFRQLRGRFVGANLGSSWSDAGDPFEWAKIHYSINGRNEFGALPNAILNAFVHGLHHGLNYFATALDKISPDSAYPASGVEFKGAKTVNHSLIEVDPGVEVIFDDNVTISFSHLKFTGPRGTQYAIKSGFVAEGSEVVFTPEDIAGLDASSNLVLYHLIQPGSQDPSRVVFRDSHIFSSVFVKVGDTVQKRTVGHPLTKAEPVVGLEDVTITKDNVQKPVVIKDFFGTTDVGNHPLLDSRAQHAAYQTFLVRLDQALAAAPKASSMGAFRNGLSQNLSVAQGGVNQLLIRAKELKGHEPLYDLYRETLFALATIYLKTQHEGLKRQIARELKLLGEASDSVIGELEAQALARQNMSRLRARQVDADLVVNISATTGGIREDIQRERLAISGFSELTVDGVLEQRGQVLVNPHDSYVDSASGQAIDSYHYGSLTGAIRGFEPVFGPGGILQREGLDAAALDRRAREEGKIHLIVIDLKGGAGTRSAIQTLAEGMNKAFIKVHNREFGEQGNQQIMQLIGDPANPERSLSPGAYVVIVPADNIAIFEPSVGDEYHLGQDADLFTPAARVLGAPLDKLNYFSGLGNLFRDPKTHGVKKFSEKPKKFILAKLVLLNAIDFLIGPSAERRDQTLYHRVHEVLAKVYAGRPIPMDFVRKTLELAILPYFWAENDEVLKAFEADFDKALAEGDTSDDWANYKRNWAEAVRVAKAIRADENLRRELASLLDRYKEGILPESNLNTFYFKMNALQAEKLYQLMSRPLQVQPAYAANNPAPYNQASYWKVVSDITGRQPGKQPATYEMSDWSTIVLTSVTLTREEWARERENFMNRKKVPAAVMYSPEDWQRMRLFIFEVLRLGMRDSQGRPTLPRRKADFLNLMDDYFRRDGRGLREIGIPESYELKRLGFTFPTWNNLVSRYFDFINQDEGILKGHQEFAAFSGEPLTADRFEILREFALGALRTLNARFVGANLGSSWSDAGDPMEWAMIHYRINGRTRDGVAEFPIMSEYIHGLHHGLDYLATVLNKVSPESIISPNAVFQGNKTVNHSIIEVDDGVEVVFEDNATVSFSALKFAGPPGTRYVVPSGFIAEGAEVTFRPNDIAALQASPKLVLYHYHPADSITPRPVAYRPEHIFSSLGIKRADRVEKRTVAHPLTKAEPVLGLEDVTVTDSQTQQVRPITIKDFFVTTDIGNHPYLDSRATHFYYEGFLRRLNARLSEQTQPSASASLGALSIADVREILTRFAEYGATFRPIEQTTDLLAPGARKQAAAKKEKFEVDEAAVRQVVDARTKLWENLIQGNVEENLRTLARIAGSIPATTLGRLYLEYELSMVGIDPRDGVTVTVPSYLKGGREGLAEDRNIEAFPVAIRNNAEWDSITAQFGTDERQIRRLIGALFDQRTDDTGKPIALQPVMPGIGETTVHTIDSNYYSGLIYSRLETFEEALRALGLVPEDIFRPGVRVLEVAAGSGELGEELMQKYPGLQYTGTDWSIPAVAFGRERSAEKLGRPLNLVPANSTRLPFPDESFDIIIGAGYPGPYNDTELGRVVTPEGKFIVFEGAPYAVLVRQGPDPGPTWNVSLSERVFLRPRDLYKQEFYPRRSFYVTGEELKGTAAPVEKGTLVRVVGLSGTGKTTAAAQIAKDMNAYNISAGQLYRALAYIALENNLVSVSAEGQVTFAPDAAKTLFNDHIRSLEIRNNENFQNVPYYRNQDISQILIDREVQLLGVTKALAQLLSPQFELYLLNLIQLRLAQGRNVVLDGRVNILPEDTLPAKTVDVLIETPIDEAARRASDDLIRRAGSVEAAYNEHVTAPDRRPYSEVGEASARESVYQVALSRLQSRWDAETIPPDQIRRIMIEQRNAVVFDTTSQDPDKWNKLLQSVESRAEAASLGQLPGFPWAEGAPGVPRDVAEYFSRRNADRGTVEASLKVAADVTEWVFYLPEADATVVLLYKDVLDSRMRPDALAELPEEDRTAAKFFDQDRGFSELFKALGYQPTERPVPTIVFTNEVLKTGREAQAREEAQKMAAAIAKEFNPGDLLVAVWKGDGAKNQKPPVIAQLYQRANGIKVRDIREEIVSDQWVASATSRYDMPPVSIASLNDTQDLYLTFKNGGVKVKMNLDILIKNGINPVKALALVRQLADNPERREEVFQMANLEQKNGYWEMGMAFVNLVQRIYRDKAVQERIAAAA
ncbi:MAG: methyltransferase domain-containing protein [Candidatus Omnitrophica bacterium]|nr:methyltransferase domain-containing protein [Candidatus Omnitrophota bacterium]